MVRALLLLALLAAIDESESLKVKRALSDLRTMASAIEAYAHENNDGYPRAANMAELRTSLDPRYVQGLRISDPWGNDYSYLVTDDAHHYRIVCAGSDAKFEKAYQKMKADAPKQQLSPDATYDIVYQDGAFRVVPEGFEKAFTQHEMKRTVPFH
jgi:hypothetical protein